ncbi:MAG: MFS transporter [Aeriscardovia sp.]|nr:MFS transporter [Aeriscardovia sp.]
MTTAVSTTVCGRVADSFGRKPVFLVGLALFAVGSLMSGLSVSMPELIVFRGLMGLEGGAIMTVTFTIIADVTPLERRPKVMAFNTTSPEASPRLSDRCSPASSSAR